MKMDKNYFTIKLTSENQVKEFFNKLYKDGYLYHPEDDSHDICNTEGKLFTDEQCESLNSRMDEVYEIMDDPCEYILKSIYKNFENE
jgi:methionyl-tRNA synthetase